MKYYPVFLRVVGRPCVVIGGGSVAQHKVEALMRAGAQVSVISPTLTARLAARAAARQIVHERRCYAKGDLRGCVLAYAATDDAHVQQQVAAEAREAGVLLNVVDRPDRSDFITPAIVERGDLVVAVSTGGASPALAKRIRHDLEGTFGAEYEFALHLFRRLRTELTAQRRSPAERRRIFSALANSALLDYLRLGQTQAVNRLLAETAGGGISLTALGMELN
ncbi:MAG: precorrin-2 dehydrogenase [Deltaproteobacteria bacterium]|jgi:precorrin-2 dehydrogenase/sirohydrochlorin ferrochelatase|nr:precorrin-2 dehydrogenase [Deltaproteobacteria bacterium]